MTIGDEVVTVKGNNLKLLRITIVEKVPPVFNITVGGLHSYFVGKSGFWFIMPISVSQKQKTGKINKQKM